MRVSALHKCVQTCILVVITSSSATAFSSSFPTSLSPSPSPLTRSTLASDADHHLAPLPRCGRRQCHSILALKMIRKVDDAEERPSRKSYVNTAIDTFITLGGVLALSRLAAVFFAKLAQMGGSGPIWPQEQWNKL
eukprot:887238-Rhodomonas_salina.2